MLLPICFVVYATRRLAAEIFRGEISSTDSLKVHLFSEYAGTAGKSIPPSAQLVLWLKESSLWHSRSIAFSTVIARAKFYGDVSNFYWASKKFSYFGIWFCSCMSRVV